MNKPRRGNRNLMRAMNRNLLLNIIRSQGPLSRTQLTELSGLSVGAVSQIVTDLIETQWVTEAGESDSTGGRRQVLLRLNPTAGYVVGLKLMENRAVCAVTDLEATVLSYLERSLPNRETPTAVAETLSQTVIHAVYEADIAREKVRGLGVGLAGVINSTAGIVHYSPFFHWQNVPLADILAQELSLPVYLENDVNTLTITEQLFGPGHGVANFAVLTIGRGIGLGVVINHQLYRGHKGGVGELGHITLLPDGPLCDCGKRGCLEALAADPAILRELRHALDNGTPSCLTSDTMLDGLTQAAEQGDELAQDLLKTSGHYLGLGLATMVNLFCPSLIIISGEGVTAGPHRLDPMLDALRAHAFNGLLEDVDILIKHADDQAWARGAAGLVVGKLFESPLLQSPQTP
ncbi:MAG: ROK family transcriptional regulator [Chloroflexi bacterium]|nr:ROK family transcriptional regulator [Chloroflexota bacterium]